MAQYKDKIISPSTIEMSATLTNTEMVLPMQEAAEKTLERLACFEDIDKIMTELSGSAEGSEVTVGFFNFGSRKVDI